MNDATKQMEAIERFLKGEVRPRPAFEVTLREAQRAPTAFIERIYALYGYTDPDDDATLVAAMEAAMDTVEALQTALNASAFAETAPAINAG